jgi:hypothetical protein
MAGHPAQHHRGGADATSGAAGATSSALAPSLGAGTVSASGSATAASAARLALPLAAAVRCLPPRARLRVSRTLAARGDLRCALYLGVLLLLASTLPSLLLSALGGREAVMERYVRPPFFAWRDAAVEAGLRERVLWPPRAAAAAETIFASIRASEAAAAASAAASAAGSGAAPAPPAAPPRRVRELLDGRTTDDLAAALAAEALGEGLPAAAPAPLLAPLPARDTASGGAAGASAPLAHASLAWFRAGSSRLHHLTVASTPRHGLVRLVRSAERFPGAPPVVVLGDRDPRFSGWGVGMGVKLELLLDAAEAAAEDDAILFTDAFDAVLQTSAWEALL